MHFSTRRRVMKLVEVVRSVVTEPEVVEDVEALAQRLGKSDVTIGDKAGFIANFLLLRLPEPRRLDVRAEVRQPGGHRRGDEAGLRPADGAAAAARPDRPGRVRDRDDVRGRRDQVEQLQRPIGWRSPAFIAASMSSRLAYLCSYIETAWFR